MASYQLSDNPYMPQGHVEMPSSDRLADQPTVSCARFHGSYPNAV